MHPWAQLALAQRVVMVLQLQGQKWPSLHPVRLQLLRLVLHEGSARGGRG